MAVAGGTMERRWPGHSGLSQTRAVTGIHSIRSFHLPMRMAICVRVTPVLYSNGRPWLPPQMLWRLQGSLPFPWYGKRQRETFL
ncbi:hypothetical protein XELAEV_18019012mg [Xenopus laevis]|uniref:Uncharacterized protein n=1 Tax=Xenopus laevis TaxID=8355 RepID=A0A974DF97_XENLA|nr:hypothetical protein XELAEV_18019012mg [Xenopus laevis]